MKNDTKTCIQSENGPTKPTESLLNFLRFLIEVKYLINASLRTVNFQLDFMIRKTRPIFLNLIIYMFI